jgi:hypothetical protein
MRKLLVLVGLVLSLATVAPAHAGSFGYEVSQTRSGYAVAERGDRMATISLQQARVERQDGWWHQPPVCVSIIDKGAGVYVSGCADNPFTIAAGLRSARANGTMPATVRRRSDNQPIGTTTLRYDIAWSRMKLFRAEADPDAGVCPQSPWLRGYTTWLASPGSSITKRGQTVGYVSADGYGKVKLDKTNSPWSVLAESADVGSSGSTAAPPNAKPRCYERWDPVIVEAP